MFPLSDGFGAEEKPEPIDDAKRGEPTEVLRKFLLPFVQEPVAAHEEAVQGAPQDKGVVRAVPKSAEEEDNHDIDVGPDGAFPVSAQWDVDVLGEKLRQGDVPAFPEIFDGKRLVRRIEIHRQGDIQHLGGADGHVAVAAEVEIDFKGIKEHHEQPVETRRRSRMGKCPCDAFGKDVGNHHFFEEAEAEDLYAAGDIVPVDFLLGLVIDLPEEIEGIHERTHQNFREIEDVGEVIEERSALDLAAADGDEPGNLLERKKADPQRQREFFRSPMHAGVLISDGNEKIGVFEIQKQPDIDENRSREKKRGAFYFLQQETESKIQNETNPQRGEKCDVRIRIKDDTGADKDELAASTPPDLLAIK